MAAGTEFARLRELNDVIDRRRLTAVYQPIVHVESGEIFAFEGLVRGPAGGPLEAPRELFSVAERHGRLADLEWLCLEVVTRRFLELGLPQRLFLNVSPDTVAVADREERVLLDAMRRLGEGFGRVTIELTEHRQARDPARFRRAVELLRELGFGVALDDLGEGFSSLRLWSELRPEFVKVDMHFVQGVHHDPLRFHFMQALQQIGLNCGSALVAEGIEDVADLKVIRDLGVQYVQGYLIARPSAQPSARVDERLLQALDPRSIAVYPQLGSLASRRVTVNRLMNPVTPVAPSVHNDAVLERFEADPALLAVPVVDDGRPVGMINRFSFIDGFARLYRRELYGRRPCTALMNPKPLIVECDTSIHDLSRILMNADQRHLAEGFIVVARGYYLGCGTGQGVIREVARLQLEAARYANPLTFLPGNVPIDEHVDRLLDARVPFVACYCDLNHFKPYNDAYGYARGDELIRFTARVLAEAVRGNDDFVGHIGGDDFMLLLQSEDWEARCRGVLERFGKGVAQFIEAADLARGALDGEDRQGQPVEFPLVSLAMGALRVRPGEYSSHLAIAAAAAEAKRQAKRAGGNCLFIERRSGAAD